MNTPDLPGYKVVYQSPEKGRRPEAANERTRRYIPWLRQRQINKTELHKLIYDQSEQPIDLDELKKAPLFEFGKGFAGHPPAEYQPGEVPPQAPMSREQMRLLLIRVVPATMIPFIIEHFTFDYDLPTNPTQPVMGPTVKIEKDKVNVTFHHTNFFSAGQPSGTDTELASIAEGFVDPSKITIFLGKIIAQMIEPPANWHDQADPAFWLTKDTVDPKTVRRQTRLPKTELEKQRLAKQWQDFAALSIAAPDLARQKYPLAYEYFNQQVERFADVSHDKEAIRNLQKNAGDGLIQLNDFQLALDLRTEEERSANQKLTPELAWYDKFTILLNSIMAPFGRKIVLNVPEDMERAAALADDDKVIKTLILSGEQQRDIEFGEILGSARDFDVRARNDTRRYLLAASQTGKFDEWRIYAWLYKFSSTFRRTHGKQINENDYKDLQLIYDQAKSVGKRLGAAVLPYKPVVIGPDIDPRARLFPRTIAVYVRNQDYEQEMADEIKNMSPRAIFDAIPSVIKPFEKGVPYDATYNATPEGLKTLTGNLDDLLGKQLGHEVATWLGDLGVEKIPADAKAIATAYYEYYKKMGRQYPKDINPLHVSILERYADHLNQPPEKAAEELQAIPAEQISQSEDLEYVFERANATKETEKNVLNTVMIAARQQSNLSPDIQAYLRNGLENGVTDTGLLMTLLNPVIAKLFQGNPEQIRQEQRNLFRFLNTSLARRTVGLLEKVQKYHEKLVPTYTENFKETAELLTTDENKPGQLLPESITEEQFAIYQKMGIKLDAADTQAINEAGSIDINAAGITDTTKPEAGVTVDEKVKHLETEAEVSAKNTKRAEILVAKVKSADDKVREEVVLHLAGDAIKSLDAYLERYRPGQSYTQLLNDWLRSAGKIFNASSLKVPKRDLESAIRLLDKPQTVRIGLEKKTEVRDAIMRALNYQDHRLHKVKTKKPETATGLEGAALNATV